MITQEELALQEEELFKLYRGRCANCFWNKAVCIHEIEPRSLRPNDWHVASNRIPLCNECHEEAHSNRIASVENLKANRRKTLFRLNGC